MSDWRDYLDVQHPDAFDPDSPLPSGEPRLIASDSSGMLLRGVEPHITTEVGAARQFLSLMRQGQINLAAQQRCVRLLLELHQRVHTPSSPLSPLATELRDTLLQLEAQVETVMVRFGASLSIDREHLSEHYGFGGDAAAIRYALTVARSAALSGFTRAFCKMAVQRSKLSDLCGDWKLHVSVPQDPEYAQAFAGVYGAGAEAVITTEPDQASWEVRFQHFPPWLNWYGLEGAAYGAAAPVLAEGLQATVVAVGTLSD